MKKRVYIKPSFKEVEIRMNDLCVGSACTQVDVSVMQGSKSEKTRVYIQSQTEGFWDSDF